MLQLHRFTFTFAEFSCFLFQLNTPGGAFGSCYFCVSKHHLPPLPLPSHFCLHHLYQNFWDRSPLSQPICHCPLRWYKLWSTIQNCGFFPGSESSHILLWGRFSSWLSRRWNPWVLKWNWAPTAPQGQNPSCLVLAWTISAPKFSSEITRVI